MTESRGILLILVQVFVLADAVMVCMACSGGDYLLVMLAHVYLVKWTGALHTIYLP